MKVSLVIIVINNFTNKVIKDSSIRVYIKNKKAPILKNDGYYIFTDIKDEKVEVIIEGIEYNKLIVPVILSGLDKKNPIIKIRIQPSRNYSLENKTTCLEIFGKCNEKIKMILIESDIKYKLFQDYKSKKSIAIYNSKQEDLEGLEFAIIDKNNEWEIFKVLDKLENSLWSIEKKLNKEYLKLESTIVPVYDLEIHENEKLFLPIKEFFKQDESAKIFIKNKGEYIIEKGKNSIIDLR